MNQIGTKGLLLRIFTPTAVLSLSYLLLGYFCRIPYILLFCILGTFILVPIELGIILRASKSEYGKYSLKSAFVGQEKSPFWKVLIIAFIFFGIAGLLSAFVAPVENQVFAGIRSNVLNSLPVGFDWTDYEYLKNFSQPMLIITFGFRLIMCFAFWHLHRLRMWRIRKRTCISACAFTVCVISFRQYVLYWRY